VIGLSVIDRGIVRGVLGHSRGIDHGDDGDDGGGVVEARIGNVNG
jgi:hypothetical protein